MSSKEQTVLATVNQISIEHWLSSLGVALVAYLVLVIVFKWILPRVLKIQGKHLGHLRHVLAYSLDGTRWSLMLVIALTIGGATLPLSDSALLSIQRIGLALTFIQFAIWGHRVVSDWTVKRAERAAQVGGPNNPVLRSVFSWGMKLAIWVVVLLFILANYGVNITAFVASLGVGGVAIALAVQNILSDIFASLAIGLDKPFEVGDFIVFGADSGTIERIGLKTTRIRSISGEEIVYGNTGLLQTIIHNYRQMRERRIVFAFGVTYDTPVDQVRAIPALVKDIIGKLPDIRLDRAHFKTLGESALSFEVVYYVTTDDYTLYMDRQQEMNLVLMERLAERGIQFAFPSRTLYLSDPGGKLAAGAGAAPGQSKLAQMRQGAQAPVT